MAKKAARGIDVAEVSALKITKLVIHEVPVHAAGSEGDGPVLSEYLAPLDRTLKSFFQDRVKETIGRQAQPIEEDSNTSSKVPLELRALVGSPDPDLLSISQAMARHLYSAQNLTNSEGLLAVAIGTITGDRGTVPAALVMKLEKSEGANLRRETKGNKTALTPRHVQDLMLSDKTRVFKAAVIRDDDGQSLVGIVSDAQTQSGAESFRGGLLGFRLSRSLALVTRQFSEAVDRWITDNISDPERIIRYRTALRVELDSHAKQLSPRTFVSTHIDPKDRQPLEDHLKASSIPMMAFEKSKAELKPRHMRTKTTTQKGIQISGDAELMGRLIEPYVMSDGERVTLIHDLIVK